MSRKLSIEVIREIQLLRKQGWSLPEIKKQVKVGHATIHRYIQGVEILPEYISAWFGKRGGSKKRQIMAEREALLKAEKLVDAVSVKEKIIFMAGLYWAEGSKSDFSFSNTDPIMIKVYVKLLKEVFHVSRDDLRISIRIYQDLDREKCLNHWAEVTGVSADKFVNVNVLEGKKVGKLQYGMCRVRVKKAGNLLKFMTALRSQISKCCLPL